MRRVTVEFNGQQVEGEEVGWKVLHGEDWAEYQCDDGTLLKLKTIVGRIIRLDQRKPDGEPIYVVHSGNTIITHVQPHLMAQDR
jgi:hypothetical protein